jgi:HD-GYP domain-containing protein (c-di-GMP phosphodiesterase class II)
MKDDDDLAQNARAEAAGAFYSEFSGLAATFFAKYVSDGVINLAQVTEWVERTIPIVDDSRGLLLRFLKIRAEGDSYLASHAVNTTILTIAMGQFLKAPLHRLIELGNACLLHEIGMFKLPADLRRSSEPLNEDQKKILATHTLLGYRILKGFSAPENVALAALEHHERVDGTGYPRGLSGDRITEYSKIIAVACSLDAMISTRPFKLEPPDGHSSIKDLLQKHRRHYDDRVLKAIVHALEVRPIGLEKPPSAEKKGPGGFEMPSGGLSGARVPRPPSGAPHGTVSASLESPTRDGETD